MISGRKVGALVLAGWAMILLANSMACGRRTSPTESGGGGGDTTGLFQYYIRGLFNRHFGFMGNIPDTLIYAEVSIQDRDTSGRYRGDFSVLVNGDTLPPGTLQNYIMYSGFLRFDPGTTYVLQILSRSSDTILDTSVTMPAFRSISIVQPESAHIYTGESLQVVWQVDGSPQGMVEVAYVIELGSSPGLQFDTLLPVSAGRVSVPPEDLGFPGDQAAIFVNYLDTIGLSGQNIADGSHLLVRFGDRKAVTVTYAPAPSDTLQIIPTPSPTQPTIDWDSTSKALFVEVRRCVDPADSCRNNYTVAWAVDANWDSTGIQRVPFPPPVVYGEEDTTRYYIRVMAESTLSTGILYYFRVDFEDGTYGARYYTP